MDSRRLKLAHSQLEGHFQLGLLLLLLLLLCLPVFLVVVQLNQTWRRFRPSESPGPAVPASECIHSVYPAGLVSVRLALCSSIGGRSVGVVVVATGTSARMAFLVEQL